MNLLKTLIAPTEELANQAQSALQKRLPELDVDMWKLQNGHLLVPPHLMDAIEVAGILDPTSPDFPDISSEVLNFGEESLQQVIAACSADLMKIVGDNPTKDEKIWHLERCKAAEALKAAAGLAFNSDWPAWLRVGHIDTGFTKHDAFGPPFQQRLSLDRARSFIRLPDVDGPNPGEDQEFWGLLAGHGTASGSVISGHAPSFGFSGIAPGVPLVPVRIGGDVFLDFRGAQFEDAVRYLVDEAKTPVINVSMGTGAQQLQGYPARIARAVDYAYEHGVIMVCAAGNLPEANWPTYPACLPRTISVAGVTDQDRRWALSTTASWVDISAPAKSIYRAIAFNNNLKFGLTAGGTTFATAMTSGAAALWLRQHGNTELQQFTGWKRVEAFRRLLRQTSRKPADWNPSSGLGDGILDIAALLDAPLPDPTSLTGR